jgi:hypothetical protein
VGSDGTWYQVLTWKLGDSHPTTVSIGAGQHSNVHVSGDRLAWLAPTGANDQVFTWKVGDASPTQLTIDAGPHQYPGVSGDRLVWRGSDGVHTQIYSAAPYVSLTIKSSATSAKIGTQFILSGVALPSPTLVGKMMHVDVRKPGKSYWSYSSNRIIYAGAGGVPSWQYKYTLKGGMAKGTYQFRAVYTPDDSYAGYTSAPVKVTVK